MSRKYRLPQGDIAECGLPNGGPVLGIDGVTGTFRAQTGVHCGTVERPYWPGRAAISANVIIYYSMPEEITIVATVDATNLNCPLPLLKAKQGLKPLAAGECLKVIATDPGSRRDFQVFAELSGNTLVTAEEADKVYTYIIKKA